MEGLDGFIARTLTIQNRLGLHARAAAALVKITNKFSSDLFVSKDGQEVNGKSIMGLLILAAAKGTQITVKAKGEDAGNALDAVEELVDGLFGEGE